MSEIKTNYYNPFGCRTFVTGGIKFYAGCARGYNAGGLIGTEQNGIFILCLTPARFVVDRILPQKGCWYEDKGHVEKCMETLAHIEKMEAGELEDYICWKGASYNPFADRRATSSMRKLDKNIRRDLPLSAFIDSPNFTAKAKRALLHSFERFVVFRIVGGGELAAPKFTPNIYNVLTQEYGHIAHYNRMGFYEAQLRNDADFKRNMKRIAAGLTAYNLPVAREYYLHIMGEVAKAYLNVIP